MNKKKSNKSLNTENNFSDLENYKFPKDSPFSVPDNFFDQLEKDIFSKTLNSGYPIIKKENLNWLKIGIYSTTVAAAILIFGLFVFTDINKKDSDNSFIAKTFNKKQEDKNLASKNQNANQSESSDKISGNSGQDTSLNLEKFNQNQVELIPNNTKPSTIANNILPKKEEKVNSTQNLYQIPNYQNPELYNSSDFTPAIASVNFSGTTANQYAYPAKLSNGKTIVTGFLGKDSCSLETIRLDGEVKNTRVKYLWSNASEKPIQLINKSGTYWLKIFDLTGELIGLDTININIIKLEKPDLGPDQTICLGSPIDLDTKIDNEDYCFYWNISGKKTSKIQLNNLAIGTYKVKVEARYCGFKTTDEMTLTITDCQLHFPNVITPNGDGINDKFVIGGLEEFPGSTLFVMDRNGKIVYEDHNYQNDWIAENINSGTYYYVLRKSDSKHTEYSGTISVVKK